MSWRKKITWFAHINITASCKYELFVLWSVHYKDSPHINSCVFIQHHIGDEDGIKKGTLFIFTSRSCTIENINNNNKNFKCLALCLFEEGIIYRVNMAIANLTLPSCPVFTLDYYTTVSTHWKKYKWRFENWLLH